MASWRLASSLERLRQEVNARWPDRDKRSDGTALCAGFLSLVVTAVPFPSAFSALVVIGVAWQAVNVVSRQFMETVPAYLPTAAVPLLLILHVVGLRARDHVLHVEAGGNIACMADDQSSAGQRPVSQQPDGAMCPMGPPANAHLPPATWVGRRPVPYETVIHAVGALKDDLQWMALRWKLWRASTTPSVVMAFTPAPRMGRRIAFSYGAGGGF